MKTIVPYLLSFAALLLTWLVAAHFVVHSALFPSPISVFWKSIELLQDGTLEENVWQSVARILSGFALGSALGIPIGLLIGNFRLARQLIEPWTEFLRFIPATAMITVAVIWFGIGEESKIFLIAYSTIFIVVLNTASGVSAIAPNKIRLVPTRGRSFCWCLCPPRCPSS
jgi:ABC-type nitrate/sulfonate/bicarbonate transport system permease component